MALHTLISRACARALPVACVASLAVGSTPEPAGAQEAPAPILHVPPVSVPISEPFTPPQHPFGPGNRGLKYDTEPGTQVRASADGEVVFAGRVAWEMHVTVRHADGVRTSYSFLSRIDVVVGQAVRQGDPLGLAGDLFHFGARRGDDYFDPASLFGIVEVEIELLPLEVPPGSTPGDERAALLQLISFDGGWSLSLPDLPSTVLGAVPGWLPKNGQLVRHYITRLHPLHQARHVRQAWQDRSLSPPDCTPDDVPVAFLLTDRAAVTVGGLGSSSESASIDRLDLGTLGYAHEDVLRFSYVGGHTPQTGGAGFGGSETTTYTSADTQGDLGEAALHLVELVASIAAERPHAAIDLYAHSMGGLVTRLALRELERRGFPLERLGVVATIGSPHEGANLATAVQAANDSGSGRVALRRIEQLLGTELDPDATAVTQLSEVSELVAELGSAGVPQDVELVSIAARGDLVVPAPRTRVKGARNATVPTTGRDAHSDMVASDATTRELGLALAGAPQRCKSWWEHLGDAVAGQGISYTQDQLGASLLGLL